MNELRKSTFSEREGIEKPEVDIQKASMDERLKNKLWNAVYLLLLKRADMNISIESYSYDFSMIADLIWLEHFCLPYDDMPKYGSALVSLIKHKYGAMKWNQVYDFLDFIATELPDRSIAERLMEQCNRILEEERSAYHFVGGILSPITSEIEISAIESAISSSAGPVRQLMEKALREFSNRDKPDYPNSIKDSISAVESLCKIIADEKNKTLSDSLKRVGERLGIHGSLLKSLDSLYGYRNVKSGVGHGSTQTISE